MDFSFTEEQRDLAGLAEQLFARTTPDRVAAVEATADRVDRDLWSSLAESGLLGIAIPEQHGGAGQGLLELCLVLEQQGRRVAPVPLVPTLVMGALPVAAFGTDRQQAEWLPGVADGSTFLTAALTEARGVAPVSATRTDRGWRLSGTAMSAPAAHLAARVLVPATTDTGDIVVAFVDPCGSGSALEFAETTNREQHPHLHLDGVHIADDDVLGDTTTAGWMRSRALVALCALQVGVAEEAVRMTAAYTTERKQFDRPLATFQGVALRAADAYIDTEAMRVTMWQAAWRLSAGLDATREVALAKWWAGEGGHRVGHAAQHLHGGMGADVSYPIHRYYLWAKQVDLMLGTTGEHLARLGRLLADDAKARTAS